MKIYDNSSRRPDKRRFETKPAPPPEVPTETVDTADNITCVEDRAAFDNIRSMVFQKFQPASSYDQLMAEEHAEDIWLKQRFTALSNHALSFKIEEEWDRITDRFPNADSPFRALRAWQAIQSDPGSMKSYDLQDRLWRRRRQGGHDLVRLNKDR